MSDRHHPRGILLKDDFRKVMWDLEPLLAQTVENLPALQRTWVLPLGGEDPLEKGMATHSSILAWRAPWTEEPGGLPSMGSQRVGHVWASNTFTCFPNQACYVPGYTIIPQLLLFELFQVIRSSVFEETSTSYHLLVSRLKMCAFPTTFGAKDALRRALSWYWIHFLSPNFSLDCSWIAVLFLACRPLY